MIPDSPSVTLAVLTSAGGDVVIQQLGNRGERRSSRLAWDQLVQIYGTEELLKERIKELRGSSLPVDQSLLDLVDRYASGWRPKQFEFHED